MKYTTVVGRIEKRPTSYVDVRSQVLEDVQKEREQAWLLKLRQQYSGATLHQSFRNDQTTLNNHSI